MKKQAKPCNQVVKPTVDNTELECDEFISAKCIRINKSIPLLGLIAPYNLEEFINAYSEEVRNLNRKILMLKKKRK